MPNVDPAVDEAIDHRIREFLKTLNSSGGKPLEALSPKEARQVLVGAQQSVKVELAPAEVSTEPISHDGQNVELTVIRPKGAGETTLPVFMFFHGGGWVL